MHAAHRWRFWLVPRNECSRALPHALARPEEPCRPADFSMPIPRLSRSGPTKEKGLPKKAFQINNIFWLPDLGSNQGPAD